MAPGTGQDHRIVLLLVAIAGLAGCPVGCPKGNPPTVHEGPAEEVHLERIGKCLYRATPPLQHPFQPAGEGMEGTYVVVLNNQATWWDWYTYEPGTATFTIKDPFCSRGVSSFQVTWHPLVRTVNE